MTLENNYLQIIKAAVQAPNPDLDKILNYLVSLANTDKTFKLAASHAIQSFHVNHAYFWRSPTAASLPIQYETYLDFFTHLLYLLTEGMSVTTGNHGDIPVEMTCEGMSTYTSPLLCSP